MLIKTARALVASGKGLLAMDESTGTCNRRFADAGIAQTLEMRRAWRELLLTAPGLSTCISGVILYDETIRQASTDGTPFVQLARDAGLLIGIKVDLGAKDLAAHPGEKVTEGLDGLRERLQLYFEMGARFAKWRGVIAIDPVVRGRRPAETGLPTPACIEANAHALARYAALCQVAGLVPVVEPEVLMEGAHSRQRCAEVTESVLRAVFEQLNRQGVVLEAMVLKPNMVTAGLAHPAEDTDEGVAAATLQSLLRTVPAAVPGIAFLSGGQPGPLASSRLNAMHAGAALPTSAPSSPAATASAARPAGGQALPWAVTFSFSRALQHPALGIWAGADANRPAAQQALMHRALCNRAALTGDYTPAMELA